MIESVDQLFCIECNISNNEKREYIQSNRLWINDDYIIYYIDGEGNRVECTGYLCDSHCNGNYFDILYLCCDKCNYYFMQLNERDDFTFDITQDNSDELRDFPVHICEPTDMRKLLALVYESESKINEVMQQLFCNRTKSAVNVGK